MIVVIFFSYTNYVTVWKPDKRKDTDLSVPRDWLYIYTHTHTHVLILWLNFFVYFSDYYSLIVVFTATCFHFSFLPFLFIFICFLIFFLSQPTLIIFSHTHTLGTLGIYTKDRVTYNIYPLMKLTTHSNHFLYWSSHCSAASLWQGWLGVLQMCDAWSVRLEYYKIKYKCSYFFSSFRVL